MTNPSSDTNGPCPNCGSANVTTIQRNATHVDGGDTVTYRDELSRCGKCDEEFYTYEQSMASSRALTASLRDARGLMSPERIRAARLKLQWSQTQFEQAFGLGAKTVARWERGTVAPSKAANFMLWVAENHPEVVSRYMHRAPASGQPSQIRATIHRPGAPFVIDQEFQEIGPPTPISVGIRGGR